MSSEPPARVPALDVDVSSDDPAVSTEEMEWREYLFFREEMRHEDNLRPRQFKRMPSLSDWHLRTRRLGMVGPLVTPRIYVVFWIVVLAKMG